MQATASSLTESSRHRLSLIESRFEPSTVLKSCLGAPLEGLASDKKEEQEALALEHFSAFKPVQPRLIVLKEDFPEQSQASFLPSAVEKKRSSSSVLSERTLTDLVTISTSELFLDDDIFERRLEEISERNFDHTLQVEGVFSSDISNSRLYLVRFGLDAKPVQGVLRIDKNNSLVRDEVCLLERLKYPGLPEIIHYDVELGYILTTTPSGTSLSELVRTDKIESSLVQQVIAQIACLIEYLGRKDVSLFDYSFENIFVNTEEPNFPISILSTGCARECGGSDNRSFLAFTTKVSPALEIYNYLNVDEDGYNPHLIQWGGLGALLFMLTFCCEPCFKKDREACLVSEKAEIVEQEICSFKKEALKTWLEASRSKRDLSFIYFDSPDLEMLVKKLLSIGEAFKGDFTVLTRNPWFTAVDWRALQGRLISCIINRKAFGY